MLSVVDGGRTMVGGSTRTHPDFEGKGVFGGAILLRQMAQEVFPNLDASQVLYTSYQWA